MNQFSNHHLTTNVVPLDGLYAYECSVILMNFHFASRLLIRLRKKRPPKYEENLEITFLACRKI